MQKIKIKVISNLFSLIVVMAVILYSNISIAENLKLGSRYKIIKPIYIVGLYDSRSDKTLSRQTAHAYLGAIKVATKSYTAYQTEIPSGTSITIITKTSRPWYHIFAADTYLVKLDPDLSQGLDVELQLNRGLEGNLDGLNSEIFIRE